MVRALLNIVGAKPGSRILDPYLGSGTTALEASLLGIDCVGVDISPLCVLLTRVKTRSVEAHARALSTFEIDPGHVSVALGDARDLGAAGIEQATVDAVVTSPPYSIALDYVKNDEHALEAMGVRSAALRRVMTGSIEVGPPARTAWMRRPSGSWTPTSGVSGLPAPFGSHSRPHRRDRERSVLPLASAAP